MKKLPYFLVTLLIVLTACTVPAAPAASGQPDASATPVQTLPLTSSREEDPVYYGTFRLASCVFSPISTMTMEDARHYLDATITYTPDSASNTFGDSCGAPSYQTQTVTAADFSAGYNGTLSLEDVNLSGEQVTSITLEGTAMFGSSFYVRSADSLVIPLDGAFFLAQRVGS